MRMSRIIIRHKLFWKLLGLEALEHLFIYRVGVNKSTLANLVEDLLDLVKFSNVIGHHLNSLIYY